MFDDEIYDDDIEAEISMGAVAPKDSRKLLAQENIRHKQAMAKQKKEYDIFIKKARAMPPPPLSPRDDIIRSANAKYKNLTAAENKLHADRIKQIQAMQKQQRVTVVRPAVVRKAAKRPILRAKPKSIKKPLRVRRRAVNILKPRPDARKQRMVQENTRYGQEMARLNAQYKQAKDVKTKRRLQQKMVKARRTHEARLKQIRVPAAKRPAAKKSFWSFLKFPKLGIRVKGNTDIDPILRKAVQKNLRQAGYPSLTIGDLVGAADVQKAKNEAAKKAVQQEIAKASRAELEHMVLKLKKEIGRGEMPPSQLALAKYSLAQAESRLRTMPKTMRDDEMGDEDSIDGLWESISSAVGGAVKGIGAVVSAPATILDAVTQIRDAITNMNKRIDTTGKDAQAFMLKISNSINAMPNNIKKAFTPQLLKGIGLTEEEIGFLYGDDEEISDDDVDDDDVDEDDVEEEEFHDGLIGEPQDELVQ